MVQKKNEQVDYSTGYAEYRKADYQRQIDDLDAARASLVEQQKAVPPVKRASKKTES